MFTAVLTSTRLGLRPVEDADLPEVFEGLSHPEVIRHYGISYDTQEACREQMAFYQSIENTKSGRFWVITSHNNDFMGIVGVYFYKAQHLSAELGYWLLPAYWRKGIMHEALSLVLDDVQASALVHRLEAQVETDNVASEKLLLRLGFQKEGVLRDCERKQERFISLSVWSRLFETRFALNSF
ncbi:MAG: GNAT family N-acetyltransferase [Bacteroidia bacterium]